MDEPLFREARLKIERANEHINDVFLRWREFSKTGDYTITVESDPESGDSIVKLASGQPVPDDFLLVIGDVIHNLWSALDYAINEIEFLTCGIRSRYTRFPVRDTRDELIAAVNGGLKQKAPPAIIDLIVDVVQPYKGGNGNVLWALHGLDIEDKHRLLIARTEITHITGICGKDDTGMDVLIPDWLIVRPYVQSYRCEGHRNLQITDKGKASFGIVFGDGMPLQGTIILPVLHWFSKLAGNTIAEMEIVFRQCRGW